MTLEELIAAVLDVPAGALTDATSQSNLSNWSSMAHINLIMALEETYSVSFTTEEIQVVKSIGDARRLLRTKGATV